MVDIDSRSRLARGRARTGFLLIAGGALLAGAVFSSDLIVRWSLEGSRITVLAHSAAGLSPGSTVWVAGRPVGRVSSISFRPLDASPREPTQAHVVVEAVIARVAEPILREDATAEVRTSDPLAAAIVAIDPGSGSAPPWNFSDTLRAAGPPLDPEAVLARADTLAMAVRSLEALAAEAGKAITSGRGSLARLREEPETLEGLRREFGTLRELLEGDLSRSSLARFVTDTLVGAAADRVAERFAALDASPERRASRRSMETATAAVEAMGTRLASLAQRIERGEGTVGRALMDGEIHRQLDALRVTVAALAEELKYSPSRWLRVRVF
ncbi:MlaD family protein [Candidatus Palauibacter sp.]|uniref:MlaD family protein n=1 Tax=Candidatus Palauibacter sp. TaxID=3101350 RepID=UPI003B5B4A0E